MRSESSAQGSRPREAVSVEVAGPHSFRIAPRTAGGRVFAVKAGLGAVPLERRRGQAHFGAVSTGALLQRVDDVRAGPRQCFVRKPISPNGDLVDRGSNAGETAASLEAVASCVVIRRRAERLIVELHRRIRHQTRGVIPV